MGRICLDLIIMSGGIVCYTSTTVLLTLARVGLLTASFPAVLLLAVVMVAVVVVVTVVVLAMLVLMMKSVARSCTVVHVRLLVWYKGLL